MPQLETGTSAGQHRPRVVRRVVDDGGVSRNEAARRGRRDGDAAEVEDRRSKELARPEALVRIKRAIPERWATPGMDALPSLAQVDFAIVRDNDGRLVPRLIELQGFPSLSAFEVV